jgi:hypothetical protein
MVRVLESFPFPEALLVEMIVTETRGLKPAALEPTAVLTSGGLM